MWQAHPFRHMTQKSEMKTMLFSVVGNGAPFCRESVAFIGKASERHILRERERSNRFPVTDQKKAAVLCQSRKRISFGYIRPVSVSIYVHKCVGQRGLDYL
jgi:hypothetical protein